MAVATREIIINAAEEEAPSPLAIKLWQRNASAVRPLAEATGLTPNFLVNQLLADLLQNPPEWVTARMNRPK